LYKYTAYSKNISSDLNIPFLKEVIYSKSDITIQRNNSVLKFCQLKGLDLSKNKDYFFAEENSILLIRPGIGIFLINGGDSITYMNLSELNIYEFCRFLLNTCMLFILYQQDFLVLHGSAVSKNDEVTIFLGKSGSGKSSLAYECAINFKHNILSEDVIAIKNDKHFSVVPSFQVIKLKKGFQYNNEFEHLSVSRNDRLEREMYSIPDELFANDETNQKIKNVVFLEWADENSLKKIDSTESFLLFFSNTLRHIPQSKAPKKEKIALEQISKIINLANTYHMKRDLKNASKISKKTSEYLKLIL